ncbi:MAG: 2-dehydropantoate 2-reductase [Halobacteriales archaeon]
MHVMVIGSGAMGALFGGRLADAGEDVTLVDVWEEHVEAINRNGLEMETPDGEMKTIPVDATTDPETVSDVDLALVFVKSTHTEEAVRGARDALDGADVLTLQNGLGNPDALADVVDESQVIAGVTAHGSTLVEPGAIRHAGRGKTRIGRYFDDNGSRVEEVAAAFTDAGIETTVAEDVRSAIWEKILVNVGINPVTALTRVRNGLLAETEPGQRVVRAAVSEAKRVAEAEGVDIEDDVVEYVLEVAEQTAANKSSMRQDVEAGRTTEIEKLNAAVVRRADEHGVAVPVNETLVDLIRLAEQREEADG